MEVTPETLPFAQRLRPQLQGTVLAAQDAGYQEARQAWNLSIDQHPALIVVAKNATDVATAVRFAAAAGLPVAVQSTGHGVTAPADGALLIRTSEMQAIDVDPTTRTARVEAGAKWGMVLEKTQAVGLAPLLGSSPDVGVVGYTLGGGMGWLARKYGLAADSVRRFELVSAEGDLLQASEHENPDLCWALRGGGGNFGIVTAMEIQLYPVTTVYGGNLFYPVGDAPEVFARYREWIESVPDELTSSIVLMNFPPLPAVPEPLRGNSFVIIRGCYCGPVEEGERYLQSWREWRSPVLDAFHEMPFAEVAAISNDPVDPIAAVSSGAWLGALSDDASAILIRHGVPTAGAPIFAFVEVRHAGGAIARVDPRRAAFGNRETPLSVQMIGMAPTAQAREQLLEAIARFKEELAPHLTGGVYMNFLEGEEARLRARDAYSPAGYHRLMSLKGQYDPHNRFRFAFAIPATTEVVGG